MSKQKPSLPKGTRDFGPAEMGKRHFILETIKKVYQKYGYAPIETPSMENLSVLQGKYGDEGDQLLFKILNSGDFLSKTDQEDISSSRNLLPKISEKGLRYDLTVPFARFVVMHQHELTFPFKRYQIQPVWRADRPQKGRYREFYQCDADAIGTDSLLCEAEIVLMIHEVFEKLQDKQPNSLDYAIKINNRKVLSGIVEVIGASGKETDFAVAIDKLDKIGQEKVKEELIDRGFPTESLQKIDPLFSLSGDNWQQLNHLKTFLSTSEIGLKGVAELEEVLTILEGFGAEVPQLEIDVTLARGLSYYTGAIFEVKPKNVEMGSISGGGRYDGLTDNFGLPNVSGVGISFGVDRIYDVLEELNLFPESNQETTQVLIVAFDEETWEYSLKALNALRVQGIKSELYPEPVKLKKQMKYGNDKNIPYVIVIGSEEMKSGKLTFKNMQEGSQSNVELPEIIKQLSNSSVN
ncbi:histidine--tRNA ligase [Marivirga lumbricoides]|uniref:Histidine--tRNA ligase n=1 Tax=Marivirga lumbricoides TaxID=1046115 RepID=A0A2T4DQJ0_9BACT|nr:histidine--tRNA ligase [Marivirga lumbricoides]